MDDGQADIVRYERANERMGKRAGYGLQIL